MFVVTVTFSIKPEAYKRFMQYMAENAQLSLRHEPACKQFDICESLEGEAEVFLYELYESKAAFDEHLNTTHFTDFTRQTTDMVLSKSVKTYHLYLSPTAT